MSESLIHASDVEETVIHVLYEAARDGDTVTVRKMLSTAGAHSLIPDIFKLKPLDVSTFRGHPNLQTCLPLLRLSRQWMQQKNIK